MGTLHILGGGNPLPEKKPRREGEVIAAEIKQIETIIRKCEGKPGFAQRVEAAKKRLAECQAEFEAARG